MRKLFWMIILFGVYVWAMTSGNDRMIIEQGKNIFQALVAWFDDAEIDYQTKSTKQKTNKKKARRWD